MNHITRRILEKLDRLNKTPIVKATRAVSDDQPGVRLKHHEPRAEPRGFGSPRYKVHKGELRPGTWRDLR